MGNHVISAIVFDKRGKILSAANNSYTKTHPLQQRAARAVGEKKRDYGHLHAEIAALVRCDWTKAHKISISRFTKDGKPALAKPCKCCQYVIGLTAIKEIEYTQ